MITRLLILYSLSLAACRTIPDTQDSSALESTDPTLLKKCESTAKTETIRKFGAYFYQNGKKFREITDATCTKNPSKQISNIYYYCDIEATPVNDNAGTVTFTAKMNQDCTHAIAIDVTGEE